ncbi:hypothetical protein [Boseongicola sp. H5]|uniref:hypothetical protein n=1 Tax=Boseongicola sp. H5 TaxID=2763261 RepID=UPI001D09F8BD|nr:hypothetical protein [Boseongicola sp. H5]
MTAPRLHVIPAIGCHKALVLRRGPTDQVASLLWDRDSGAVALGQWLHGRIHEYRSDLSPDARHMIVFAGTGARWWTAISRAPWLTALSVRMQGDAWHGGGAFTPEGRIWLNGAEPLSDPPDGLRAAKVDAYPHATDGIHMGGLYLAMMGARGWTHAKGDACQAELVKPVADGWQVILRFEIGQKNRALISNRYVLMRSDGVEMPQPDWEWAEPWGGGLQLARDGALWFAKPGKDGLEELAQIHDFKGLKFVARPAPYAGVNR